jgi:hypothetical protein
VSERAPIPEAPSEARAWALAGALLAAGVAVLAAVLSGLVGQTARQPAPAPPAIVSVAATPGTGANSLAADPARARALAHARPAILARPATAAQRRAFAGYVRASSPQTHILAAWMAGFYPIYAQAQSTFAVNWLLIASIHRQESAFSTNSTTYHGLNFAGCCGGPMQFNVTNGGAGAPSTWQLVASSYLYGHRPAVYDHRTATHPSIYDDFDAIMAGARLLSADGATLSLDGGAWGAAYDYYGHDAAGIEYADQVLARAIGWSQHGFCVNCGTDPRLLAAVHAAYGAPVAEASVGATAAVKRRG